MEKKIYVCNKCGKEFKDKSNLNEYIRFGFISQDPDFDCCTITYSFANGDLCDECNNILEKEMEKFEKMLETKFHFT